MRTLLISLWLCTFSATAQDLKITGIFPTNGQYQISWEYGQGPFEIHRISAISTNECSNVYGPFTNRVATVTDPAENGFFRIAEVPAPQTANYRITFLNEWTSINHPDRYPAGAHYSPFIGLQHSDQVQFWAPGIMSSGGIEAMAEAGSNGALISEFNTSVTAGSGDQFFQFFESNPTATFTMNQSFPLITLASMIAPSPDWFIGVHDLPLFDDGQWVEDLTVDLFPYDAGTEDGTGYSTGNPASNPKVNIFRITGAPFLNGGELRRLGTFRFQRITP